MAKKLRKQISRALKRRYDSYEKELESLQAYHVNECGYSVRACSHKISAIYDRYACKMLFLVIGFLLVAAILLAFTSCNVTRVVTTSSEYFQRGDTSCMIQTKTVETYDATKKM